MQLARAFDNELRGPVDQNFVDRGVLEQGLEGPEARDFVKEFLVEGLPVLAVEDDVLFLEHLAGDRDDLLAQVLFGGVF